MSYMYFNDPNTWRDIYDKDKEPDAKSWDGQPTPGSYVAPKPATDTSVPTFSAASGDASISVDSRALIWFAEQVNSLVSQVDEVRQELDKVKVAPGRFRASQELKLKIESEHGSILSYVDAFRNMSPALTELVAALKQLAKDYSTAEQLNSEAGVKALGAALSDFDETAAGTKRI
ncbi:hypothetical protein [Actinoplanes derwentensis]|uniref:Excreted virulence factor EspC, type VII ESX diderm n=1 Tax=Actinoplanes derwentensis TaxID=113562 RepID=A0A1H2CX50_9ACTN|nr:hypothetical protein [Actinoplanes derwentensis]GID88333.1 hypothetical protein Ade03nite_72570 [Actinoplanes derwentensis]SDT74626.1 hypothetical protein SAMN04489716_7040 [Actinoplanes derwentensis]